MKFLPERKKAETSKRNLGPLRKLHCLFHLGMLFLLLFLLRQKRLDLLLHILELLLPQQERNQHPTMEQTM